MDTLNILKKRNNVIVTHAAQRDNLKEYFFKALEDLESKYKNVKLYSTFTFDRNYGHAIIFGELTYRNNKAQLKIWGQNDISGKPSEVFYTIDSLVSNKNVVTRRVHFDGQKIAVA